MPVIIVYGGQFGDEGKGKVSEYMADKYNAKAVVRVGGSQSDHTNSAGKVFHVLPTCAGKRISVIPQGSYIDLDRLRKELRNVPRNMILIDDWASCITDEDKWEAFNSGRSESIGSHGLGVRSSVERRLDRKAGVKGQFVCEHGWLQKYTTNTGWWLKQELDKGEYIVIEGTQGFGLSNHLTDMHPYVTSCTITPEAFLKEAGISDRYVEKRVMCLRTYPIRVAGNSGPMVNEITWEIVSERANLPIQEKSPSTGRVHRVSEFDAQLVQLAIQETQPTHVVLNMVDYLPSQERLQKIYDISSSIGRPISYIGLNAKTIVQMNL